MNWDEAGQAIFANGCKPTTTPQVGTIAVQKLVVNPDGVTVPATYSIDLVCTTDGGATTVLDETVVIADGETSSLFDVPPDAECDATEDTLGIADLVSAVSDGPVTVAAGADEVVTVTNTFAGPTVGPEVVVSPAQATVAPAAVTATPRTTG